MVLPDRIELSTSPLPMECSTTELRQHARYSRNRPQKALQAGGSCHKAPAGASAWRGRGGGKKAKKTTQVAGFGLIRFPIPPAGAGKTLIGCESCLEFDHLAGVAAFAAIDGLRPRVPRPAIGDCVEAGRNPI